MLKNFRQFSADGKIERQSSRDGENIILLRKGALRVFEFMQRFVNYRYVIIPRKSKSFRVRCFFY